MANVRSVSISELEAWAIEDMIRHSWSDEGRPVGKSLLLKVFTVVREFDSRRTEPHPPIEQAIGLTEDELWAIDFHIRRGHLDPSGARVGRELLMKVFGALLDIRNAEEMKRLKFVQVDELDNPERDRRLRELREHFHRTDEPTPGDLPDV